MVAEEAFIVSEVVVQLRLLPPESLQRLLPHSVLLQHQLLRLLPIMLVQGLPAKTTAELAVRGLHVQAEEDGMEEPARLQTMEQETEQVTAARR